MLGPPQPNARNRFAFSAFVFLRLLAVIHLIAFASAWTQIAGLVGPHGIQPAGAYFAAAHRQLGSAAYFQVPSLCWLFGTGPFLGVLCAAGITLSLLLFAGVAPAICLLLLWAAYLSLINAGQLFFAFQWDGLLLETTLLAIFVAPWRWYSGWRLHEPPPLARWLAWWLLFRLMFFAGVVKLTSGDPTWRNLTALTFHYETQPLPTPLAWYAQQLPVWWHKLECAVMFAIELGVPFLLITPRRIRHAGALILAAFMAAIAATGNYTFFNALAIVLCLFGLDDAWWCRLLRLEAHALRAVSSAAGAKLAAPAIREPGVAPAGSPADTARERSSAYPLLTHRSALGWLAAAAGVPGGRRMILLAFAVFTIGYTGAESIMGLAPSVGAPPGFRTLALLVAPLRSFNSYGLFAVMTHPRPELIFEGSNDGRNWLPYEFPAKPGDLRVRPKFVAPYQPRLDWQLWFAALGSPDENPWVLSLCEHLLRGTPEVLRLLAKNPFPGQPPELIRVVRYEYHFTDAAVRARTGEWWSRTPLDLYIPPSKLR